MRLPTLLILLTLALAACTGGGVGDEATDGPDGAALGMAYTTTVQAAVQQQIDDDVAPNPLGRVFEECLLADLQALTSIGEALGVADTTGEVLNVVVQQPEEDPTTQCAIRYGESSAGAVVLSAKASQATPDETRTELRAASFVEVDEASAEGLDADRVLLFDSTQFEASRAVWVGEGFQVSLTANADIADTGALLQALPVAIDELSRVLVGDAAS